MESDCPFHPLFNVIAVFGEIELDMQSIINSHIYNGWHYRTQIRISSKYSEFLLFHQRSNNVPIDGCSDKVSYPSCLSFEALVILIKVRKLEFVSLVGRKMPDWF